MQINTATTQALYNQNINNNQNGQINKTEENKDSFKKDKYYATDAIDFFELSEDISKYQVSEKEKKEQYQTGQDVFNTVSRMLGDKKWELKDGIVLFPEINPLFSSYDPMHMEHIFKTTGDMQKEMERLEAAMDKYEWDEKKQETILVRKGDPKIALELKKEAMLRDKLYPKLEEATTYEEYLQIKEEINRLQEEETGIPTRVPSIFDEVNKPIDGKDLFQRRYHLTDEFRKTDKFEKLYKEYWDKIDDRDRKIRNEVSHDNFALQEQHLREKLSGKAHKDFFLTAPKNKEDWLSHFAKYSDKLKVLLENAKEEQRKNPSTIGTGRPEAVIPDIKKSIEFFDTIVKNLKEKWKHGNFDMVA